MDPGDHLFRRESGRMVAVLTRIFGVHNLALAEDVVQDAFCRALEVWRIRGVPQNPSAWLMATAKNSALDVLRRERTARSFAPELGRFLESEWTLAPVVEELFAADAIKDDLLRMMFSCCHPRLSEQAQVALVLHILCGFSVDETASAFVTTHAATEKRLTRAKKVLAGSKRLFDVTAPADFSARLPAVQRALYLLFNEGYHGASAETAVRVELCGEAMRLTALLLEHALGATPVTYALAALMCLDAARLPTRVDAAVDQDRSKWDQQLVVEGLRFLELSARGFRTQRVSCRSRDRVDPLVRASYGRHGLGNHRVTVRHADDDTSYTDSGAQPRHRDRTEPGPQEIRAIGDRDRLAAYPFYSATLGELELRRGRYERAREHFRAAFALARNPMERRFLNGRVGACERDETRRAYYEQVWETYLATEDGN
jgi:RNA polymerase sigma factor (sigma-70 family)